jgi:hypothetical protein
MTLGRGLGLALLAAALVACVTFAVAAGRSDRNASESRLQPGAGMPGTRGRFVVLSAARSNQCGLLATALDRMARGGSLQGSCCFPMKYHRYREQVAGLRRYAGVPEIPRDPYDVPVALAKRLLTYKRSVTLTARQRRIYAHAMKLSEEGGPCCCRCWRWSAFEGQAKFLITRRRYTARQVAAVWNLEYGCGGGGHARRHLTT